MCMGQISFAALGAARAKGPEQPEAGGGSAGPNIEVDQPQYLRLRDIRTVEPMNGSVKQSVALCAAAYGGTTRRIGNVVLDASPDEQEKGRGDTNQTPHAARVSPLAGC
jgi:hypothetical protein